MFTRFTRSFAWHAVAVLTVMLVATGCASRPTGPRARTPHEWALVAEKAVDSVGLIRTLAFDAQEEELAAAQAKERVRPIPLDGGPLFVFEEVHTSRIGQLQIAIMLDRLYERSALRTVGIEGLAGPTTPLDASWFHAMGGPEARQEREDVAVQLLADGEISAAEFMLLVFPDVSVYGTESTEEYNQKLEVESLPEVTYLVAIALRSVTPEGVAKAQVLVKRGKQGDAIDYLLNADPWVRQRYQTLTDRSNLSSEARLALIRELRSRASEIGVAIESQPREDLERMEQFYQNSIQRSFTMVNHILTLPSIAARVPTAMIVGASHTEDIAGLLAKDHIGFSVMRPQAFDRRAGQLTFEQFKRKSVGKWAHNESGSLGRIFNAQRKPPPVLNQAQGRTYIATMLAAVLLAKAARLGQQPPDSILVLPGLAGLRIDQESFTSDAYHLVFRAEAVGAGEPWKEIWAKVSYPWPAPQDATLEDKLARAITDLQFDVPDPSHIRHKGFAAGGPSVALGSRIAPGTYAIFGLTKADVVSVPH
jgi:hypothetical protein